MKCPKCGREFTEKPATSRRDKSAICPLCGQREALEDAVGAGAMSQKDADNILESLKELNNNMNKEV